MKRRPKVQTKTGSANRGLQQNSTPSRNPILPVLVLVLVLDPIFDYADEDDDEDEKSCSNGAISTDSSAKGAEERGENQRG
jgi:hypothetical protein